MKKVAFVSGAQPSCTGECLQREKREERRELANWIKQELETNTPDNPRGVVRESQQPLSAQEAHGEDVSPSSGGFLLRRAHPHSPLRGSSQELLCTPRSHSPDLSGVSHV